jgi:hypothetical protein
MKTKHSFKSCAGKYLLASVAVVLIMTTSAINAYALKPGQIDKSTRTLSMGASCETLEDPDGKLTLYSVISENYSDQFKPVTAEIPNFGFTKSVYWVRFSAENKTTSDITRYIEIGSRSLTELNSTLCKKTKSELGPSAAGHNRKGFFFFKDNKAPQFCFPCFFPGG